MIKNRHYKQIINRNSSDPIYFQIYKVLKNDIEEEVYIAGDFLPSEAFFERVFGVSRVTVRKALSLLEKDRYIQKEQGRGTRVLDYKQTFYWSRLTSFSTYLNESKHVSSIVLNFEEVMPTKKIMNLLSLNTSDKVYKLQRIRLINGVKIALSTCYITPNIPIKLTSEMFDENTSLFKILKDAGLEIGNCDETIEAQVPTNEVRELLDISDDVAVFYRERVTYDKNNVPFEFVVIHYNAYYYKYFVKSVAVERENLLVNGGK